MSRKLCAQVLHALMSENGLDPRLVLAEEPEFDSNIVELGEWAYVEVGSDSMNVWIADNCANFKLEHQLDTYQEVVDVFNVLAA